MSVRTMAILTIFCLSTWLTASAESGKDKYEYGAISDGAAHAETS